MRADFPTSSNNLIVSVNPLGYKSTIIRAVLFNGSLFAVSHLRIFEV